VSDEAIMSLAEEYYESVVERVAGDREAMPVGGWKGEFIRTIGRAILSERNRCAVIARNWQPSSHQDEQYAANSIADKIMVGER